MNESDFTAGINREVRKHPPVLVWKISDRFTTGVPDAYYSGPKADLWVEFKYVKEFPKQATVKPDLSELQKDWLRTQNGLGRNTAVIIGSPKGSIIYPDLTWEFPVPTRLSAMHSKQGVTQWVVSQVSHAMILSLAIPPPSSSPP